MGDGRQTDHEVLLAELNAASRLDWSRCVVDSSHVRALKGGSIQAPRRSTEAGSAPKHHLITDGHCTPLAVLLTGGNRNDVTQLLPLLDAFPPVRGRVGRPRRKPDSLFADRGYDHDIYLDQVRARGMMLHCLASAAVRLACTAWLIAKPETVRFNTANAPAYHWSTRRLLRGDMPARRDRITHSA